MIEFNSLGVLKRTKGMVFDWSGYVAGKQVVGYVDAVDGGRIVIKEVVNGGVELATLIQKNENQSESSKIDIPKATPVIVPFDLPQKKDKEPSLFF